LDCLQAQEMPRVAVLLSPTIVGTGNHTTCMRIAKALRSTMSPEKKQRNLEDVEIVVVPAMSEHAAEKVHKLVATGTVACMMGIHCVKSGQHLIKHPGIPFAIILGGTDINEFASRSSKDQETIVQCLEMAHEVVAFSDTLGDAAQQLCKKRLKAVSIIPQAVDVEEIKRFAETATAPPAPPATSVPVDKQERCESSSSHETTRAQADTCPSGRARVSHTRAKRHVFLLPASIRQVKDPLFLVEAFIAWSKEDPTVALRIIGNPLDAKIVARLDAMTKGTAVEFLGLVSRANVMRMMRDCVAVLNTSKSEGQCGSILEAMALAKCPVLVRGIPGNLDIVAHNETGYIFDDPKGCVAIAKSLVAQRVAAEAKIVRATGGGSPAGDGERMQDSSCTRTAAVADASEVIQRALRRVQKAHSLAGESRAYRHVLDRLLDASSNSDRQTSFS